VRCCFFFFLEAICASCRCSAEESCAIFLVRIGTLFVVVLKAGCLAAFLS
jgi:hypothetical protein